MTTERVVLAGGCFWGVQDLFRRYYGNPQGIWSRALIAMAAETMVPEAFHNGPRYSGLLAASGFAALMLLSEVAK